MSDEIAIVLVTTNERTCIRHFWGGSGRCAQGVVYICDVRVSPELRSQIQSGNRKIMLLRN